MSLAQIAKLAGVSTATVSRVMNNSSLVNDETASRVRQVADQVGYVAKPSRSRGQGRRERNGRTPARQRRVGIITVGHDHSYYMSLPVIGSFVSGVTAAAREFDVDVMLDDMPEPDQLSRLVVRNEIGGAILLIASPVFDDHRWRGALNTLVRQVPSIWAMGGHTTHFPVDHVLPDNLGIGHLAAEHLARSGCRRVATLTDQPRWPLSRQRVSMFACAALEAGLDVVTYLVTDHPDDALLYPGHVRVVASDEAAVTAMADADGPIDGFFGPRDAETVRLHPMLAAAGLRPGDNLRVVSCDNDNTQLSFLKPRPASIDLNTPEVARIAIRRLRLRMRNQAESPVVVNVQPTLVLPDETPPAESVNGSAVSAMSI